jgi:hypothetical protein
LNSVENLNKKRWLAEAADSETEDKMTDSSSRWQVSLQLLKSGLESSTAHGISRVANAKSIHLRVIWFLAFVTCSGVFGFNLFKFVWKLKNPGTSTSYHASNADFEYPDIYICFDNPLSGSRFLSVNQSVRHSVENIFNQIDKEIEKRCNSTPKPFICTFVSSFTYPSKVNSLPFHLLADSLGRRVQDLVLSSFLVQNSGVSILYSQFNVTEFYHPSYVRCLKIVLDDQQQKMLKSSDTTGGILLTLLYDTFSTGLYKYFNGSEAEQKFPTIFDHDNSEVIAPHWMLDFEKMFIFFDICQIFLRTQR